MYSLRSLITVPIRNNLAKSRPQLKTGFFFRGLHGVYSGFTREDPEYTQSKPKIDTKSKPLKEDATCEFEIYKWQELQTVRW